MGHDPHTFREKLRWRAEWAIARLLGRRFRCYECGRPLFEALPVVWRGRVVLIGLRMGEPLVRVRFLRDDTLEFCHAELDACPTTERPWLRQDK